MTATPAASPRANSAPAAVSSAQAAPAAFPPAPPAPEPEPPFLAEEPPHWAARGLSYLLIGLFVVAAVAAVAIHVPETVGGAFVLVPVRGADPVRAARDGVVASVLVEEGRSLREGDTLLTIRSQPVGDRFADMRTVEAQRRGAEERLANERRRYDSQRRADAEALRNLRSRAEYLSRIIGLKDGQVASARDLADRYRQGYERETVSFEEYNRTRMEADRLEVELEQSRSERSEALAALQELQQAAGVRDAEHREAERSLREEMERAEIRMGALGPELGGSLGNELSVRAPCAGSVLRLQVNRTGAVVQEGDVLGELACAGERLQAQLTIDQSGMALLRTGQTVKLLYDAFPYQRYGVRYATLRWISPASRETEQGAAFRALADVKDETVRVRGQARPLAPGMGGRAEIVVGRRSLVSYAFDPIRQLRESLSEGPDG